MWRVENDAGRYAEWDDGVFEADPDTLRELLALDGEPVSVTPTGPVHPGGVGDELWLYLQARRVVPGAVAVRGMPPAVSKPSTVPGAVY